MKGGDKMLMSTEEAIREWEAIYYNPNSTTEQREIARQALISLRGYA
jgi:hypothetical protein